VAAPAPAPALAPNPEPVVEAKPDPDHVPFSADERVAELAFLRDAIRDTYAHLDVKRAEWGVDLDAMYARAEPEIRAADTWSKYESVMVTFVSELHDAHVDYRRKRGSHETKRQVVRLGLGTRFVGPMLIVDEVWQGSNADKVGLKVGDRIVSIDDDTVDNRMKRLASLRSWSRLEAAQYDFAQEWPASRMPADAPLRERKLTRQRADGSDELLRVLPETTPRPGGHPPPIEVEMHGEIAVLHVRGLGMKKKELADALDDAMPKIFAKPKGLVVDLRGDEGGFEENAAEVMARLWGHPVIGGEHRVKLSARAREAHAAWKDLAEDASRPGWSIALPLRADGKAPRDYPGKLAAIVDAGCRSSCEGLALLLRAAGARLYGDRTGGASGAPITIELPSSHAKVHIPARAMYDTRNRPIEGYGLDPEDHVAATRDDIIAHRDPVLAAAIANVCPRSGQCKP
jgi:C-terminal processing protease CtpA/Prc